MSSFAAVVKSEIVRLARREAKNLVEPIRKASAQYRHDIAGLKRQIKDLEKDNERLRKSNGKAAASSAAAGDSADKTIRFSPKGLTSLRTRLGLSAQNLGLLLGVSGQTIYNWEQQKAAPRAKQRASVAALRSISRKEAQARLEQLTATPPEA